MTRKTVHLFILLLFISTGGFSQTLKFGTTEEMLRNQTSSIQNYVGVLNNTYLVVENDYGKMMDMKNNILSNIHRYNTESLVNKGNVNVNKTADEQVGPDKIIFLDFITWGNKLIGFYTIKGSSSKKTYTAFANFFDADLKPIGKRIEMGEFYHRYDKGAYFKQGGLLINGRNKLAVANEFKYSISPDSSRLVMLSTPKEGSTFNLEFKIFDKDLNNINNATVVIPVKEKVAGIDQFLSGNNGMIYVTTTTYKNKQKRKEVEDDDDFYTEVHQIDTKNNNKVQTASIELPGRSIVNMSSCLDQKGNLTSIGMYHDLGNDKLNRRVQGLFTIKLNPESFTLSNPDFKEFSNEFLFKFLYAEDTLKAKGLGISFGLTQFVHREDGGIYAIGQDRYTSVVTRGSTGAMNSYYDHFGISIYCYIDPFGKLSWVDGINSSRSYLQMSTITAGALYFYQNKKFYVGVDSNNKKTKKELRWGIEFSIYNDDGKQDTAKFIEYNDELQNFSLVPTTFFKTQANTYIVTMYKNATLSGALHKRSVMKIEF